MCNFATSVLPSLFYAKNSHADLEFACKFCFLVLFVAHQYLLRLGRVTRLLLVLSTDAVFYFHKFILGRPVTQKYSTPAPIVTIYKTIQSYECSLTQFCQSLPPPPFTILNAMTVRKKYSTGPSTSCSAFFHDLEVSRQLQNYSYSLCIYIYESHSHSRSSFITLYMHVLKI